RQHPCNAGKVNAILFLQDAARPHAGGDRVSAIDTDAPAFEIFGRADAGIFVDENRAVMECAYQEYGNCGHPLSVRARADIGGNRHLADIEFQPPNHAAEGIDQWIHLDKLQLEVFWSDGSILEGLIVALRARDCGELWSCHFSISPMVLPLCGDLRQYCDDRFANS